MQKSYKTILFNVVYERAGCGTLRKSDNNSMCVFYVYEDGPRSCIRLPSPRVFDELPKGSHKTQQKEYDMQNLIQIAVKSISSF